MNEPALFNVPRQSSPRLAWLQRHRVRLHHAAHMAEDELPWCAWLPGNDAYDEAEPKPEHEHDPLEDWRMPDRLDLCGFGRDQDEAIVSLAKKAGLRLWNEDGQQ